MPKSSVANIYIADGYAEDCNNLIDTFVNKQDLSYDAFCKIFKEMKFIQCFHGRRSEAEIAELSEEVVLVSKYFMLHKDHTFAQSVGGLYLLYLMVHLQPFKGFAPVRFIPEDVEPILKLKKTATEGKYYDVLYILGSLLIEGPVEFHMAERPYGLERQLYKYFGVQTSVATTNVSSVLSNDTEKEIELLRQIAITTENYKNKKDYALKITKSDEVLNYVQEDFAEQVQDSLKNLVKFNVVEDKETPTRNDDRNIWALKRQAMRADVKRMRHLDSVKSKNSLNKRRIKNLKKNKIHTSAAPNTANQAETQNTSTNQIEEEIVCEFLIVNNDDKQGSESKSNGTDAPIVLDLPMLLDNDIQPSKSGETARKYLEIAEVTNTKNSEKDPKTENNVSKKTHKAVKRKAKAKTKTQSKKAKSK